MVNQEFIAESYATIQQGGLSLVKADIGYGLLGNSEASIRRMYQIKNRPYTNPCIIAGNIEVLKDVASVKKTELAWIEMLALETTFAVVCPVNSASNFLSKLLKVSPWLYQQTILEGTVAVFLNSGPYINALIDKAYQDKLLLIGSSGNLSAQGNNYRFEDVPEEITSCVDYYYDGGSCLYANEEKLATTIINLAHSNIKRKGVNSDKIIRSYEAFAKANHFPLLDLEVSKSQFQAKVVQYHGY